MLWKLECIVDGRKLEQVYAALEGLVYNLSPPVRLRAAIAEQQNGAVQPKANGVFAETIYGHLKKAANANDFRSSDIQTALRKAGYSEKSYSYAINILAKKKMLRALRTKGHYKLLKV